jgi:hypothetical protein
MGWSKRKATKDGRTIPADFPDVKKKFLEMVAAVVLEKDIPPQLICNFDQTGVNIVPTSSWTLNPTAASQVPIQGSDDKRQVTMVLANSPTGHLLPPQVVYQGTTNRRHPTFNFPDGWHVTHTRNHWSNEEPTKQFVLEILVPYFKAQREALDLQPDHPALTLLDVFAAHRTAAVRDLFREHNIQVIYVPASCTGELQPLNVSGDASFKATLKELFSAWYTTQVEDQLTELAAREDQEDRPTRTTKVNLTLTKLKPVHSNWLVQAWSQLHARPELSITDWRKTGLAEAIGYQPQ